MSSGEAEYYAMVKAAAEGLGIQALAKDLGIDMKVRLWVDSTAAKAIVARIGLGRGAPHGGEISVGTTGAQGRTIQSA